MTPRPPNPLLAVLFLSVLQTPVAFAGKLDFAVGAYQFSATNKRNDTTKTLSGFGSYHAGYHHPAGDHLEIDFGYSMLATKTFGGDLSFGFDLGINYFPLTVSGPIHAQSENVRADFHQLWRPYVGAMFSQRNFQSTSSQYAGPGVRAGVEYHLSSRLAAQVLLEYRALGGPNQSEATQVNLLAGLLWPL